MRKYLSIAIVFAGVVHGAALADNADTPLPSDERIKLLSYDESDVYTITTRYGYQTNIVFSSQEEVETISVGDHSMWQIIPAGNRLFIRPMEDDATTNMTVLTNRHAYQFDLKSIGSDKAEGNIYVAKFVYKDERKRAVPAAPPPAPAEAPAASDAASKQAYVMVPSPFGYAPSVPSGGAPEQAAPPAPAAAPPVDRQLPPASTPAPAQQALTPNYNYTFAGPDELAPVQVYDDGKTTFVKYHEMKEPQPSISAVDTAGNENPVTYTIKDNTVLVDAVAGEMAIKTKDGTVHIFNEMLNPR